ncbi:MAG: DJ-1/PfpI family protein [Lachnospiraceae bacterium]|nr:DJ-1/PfpI family protein [Lachnospiraceae bacterium]
MSKVYIFMADGTEEVEALTAVDILRRAKLEVVTVSVMKSKNILTSHGIKMETDELFGESDYADGDMLVLPGGLAGTKNLKAHEKLAMVIKAYEQADKYLAAICAAPSVLGFNGVLEGKCATSYPGFEEELKGAKLSTERVVLDGKVITSRGLGTAIDFSLKLVELLKGKETADAISSGIQYK